LQVGASIRTEVDRSGGRIKFFNRFNVEEQSTMSITSYNIENYEKSY